MFRHRSACCRLDSDLEPDLEVPVVGRSAKHAVGHVVWQCVPLGAVVQAWEHLEVLSSSSFQKSFEAQVPA